MKNFKLIKGVEATPLKKLNESQELKNPDKYVFEGVFTQCSVPGHVVVNRNNRVYTEQEVLRHLGYLRDTIKENGGRLLGELDHPEGRFDIQMKEASHMITDLWYDDATHCVMGRLEVLDTPNGKTLKSLIDAGFPLYVSSRAAGDVNEKTKEVEIAQIFTYDVVCTPGFKEARLERVNESLLTDKALKYINESVNVAKDVEEKEIEVPYLIINESGIAVFNNTKISDVNKPLYEDEDVSETKKTDECDNTSEDANKEDNKNDGKKEEKIDGQEVLNDVNKFYPTMDTSGKAENINEKDKDDKKEEETDDKKGEETDDKKGDENDDKKEETDDKKEDENDDKKEKVELSDSEKEENRELIISVVGLDNDGDPVGKASEESGDSEKSEKKDDIESIEGVEKDDKEKDDNDEEHVEENAEKNDEISKAADKKMQTIKNETDDDIKEIDSIINSVKKAEGVKESIIRRYPFAISLSESNFAKFAQLRPSQKKRCAEFIMEHDIFDIRAINELWMTPLREDKKMQQNWLRLASQSDIDLYVAAPVEVQNMIEENAQLFVLDTQEEVDNFWNKTGLRQEAYRKSLNEQVVDDFNNAFKGNNKNEQERNSLNEACGYNIDDFIRMTQQMM